MGKNPEFTFERDDKRITVLGTAHVSRASADKVRELLQSGKFDAVAVELGPGRYKKITDPDSINDMDLFHILKKGLAPMVLANLALGAFQQRMAEQLDIEPGEEFRAAIDEANKAAYPVLLIDREIGVTLKRIYRNIPIWRRMNLITGLALSLASRRKVTEEEIEQLKEGDILESTFSQFAHKEKDLYETLIDERDRYMAVRLIQESAKDDHHHIIAVVGAGHFRGIRKYLEQEQSQSDGELNNHLSRLNCVPPPEKWMKLIPWIITILVLTGFTIGFSRSSSLGWELIFDWVLINGGLSAIGTLIAMAHPLTIVTAFIAAPITSLNPMIGAGIVTAAVEVWLRKPSVADFNRLRHETAHIKGWWHNRVTRILLVFLFSSLGSAIGTYLAGFRIFDRLT
ncbi:MAG: TraB/GumN family protein [Mariprofundaceae bacterium]